MSGRGMSGSRCLGENIQSEMSVSQLLVSRAKFHVARWIFGDFPAAS